MPPYKLAEVYNGEKEWFVYYHYWSLSKEKYVRHKVRLGKRDLPEEHRLRMLTEIRDSLNREFKIRNKTGRYQDESRPKAVAKISRTLLEWLDIAKLDEKLETSWKVTFSQVRNKLNEFYRQYPAFDGYLVNNINDIFLRTYVEFMKENGLASKSINKHLWGIEALSGWLKQHKHLSARIETKEFRVQEIKNETDRYPPLTHAEKELAFNYFKEHNPGYLLMLYCQYYTCIRPAELHRLQVKAFDLTRNTIFVPWLDSKNGLSAYVQILSPLAKALKAAGIEKLPKDWYLFGDKCQPSSVQYSGQFASNTWTKHRTKMGMPKEKQSYGLKHTFNVDYVENNKYKIDWEFLRRHNRHATVQQTQAYISTLTAYFLDETQSVILDYTEEK
jgi:integrase